MKFILQPYPHPSRERAIEAIKTAQDGFVVEIKPPRKSRVQEEKYHAMIGDISKQLVFCNRKWDQEDMKRLLVDAFRRDTYTEYKQLWDEVGSVEMVPSLGGSGFVSLGAQTRKFGKKLGSLFIEWLYAFGSEHAIVWKD